MREKTQSETKMWTDIHVFLETKFPINLSLVEYCLIKNQVITEKLEVNPGRNLRVFLTRSCFLRQ